MTCSIRKGADDKDDMTEKHLLSGETSRLKLMPADRILCRPGLWASPAHRTSTERTWTEGPVTITQYSVPASAIIDQLRRCSVTHFVTMPDYVQIAVNHRLAGGALPGLTIVNCATEDEAVAISLGLHIGGKTPFMSIQNQGLFAAANSLLSVGMNARTPIPILAGQWGRELANLGSDPSESARLVVRRTEHLLDALEIPHFRLESPSDIDNIRIAFEISHEREVPAVVLVGAHASWD